MTIRSRPGSHTALVLIALALVGCQPAAPPLGAGLTGALTVLGTEPFWAVEIDAAGGAVLSRPDGADVVLASLSRAATPDGARFTASSAEGDMQITLTKAACSDGMSDRVYPFVAEVSWKDETLKGCAITPEDMARTPQ